MVRDNFICVTDGVGGWIRKLEDTGLFTKEYVKHIAALYDNGQYSDLKELLDNASKMTKAIGSSTCVMAEITKDDPTTLKTCNLGDSGYLLVRPRNPKKTGDQPIVEKLFRSKTQQTRFNAPYQTGTDKVWPTKAFSTTHQIEDKDIVVMGSDGIFDNLFDEDIMNCLNQ